MQASNTNLQASAESAGSSNRTNPNQAANKTQGCLREIFKKVRSHTHTHTHIYIYNYKLDYNHT